MAEAKIRLQAVAQELEPVPDGWTAYLNRETGEVYFVDHSGETSFIDEEDEDLDLDSFPAWQREQIVKDREVQSGDNWIALPGKFEIHEWSIMKDFAKSITKPDLRDELLETIHGTGAFRQFKNVIHRKRIEDRWYEFKTQAICAIVASFLDGHGISYSTD